MRYNQIQLPPEARRTAVGHKEEGKGTHALTSSKKIFMLQVQTKNELGLQDAFRAEGDVLPMNVDSDGLKAAIPSALATRDVQQLFSRFTLAVIIERVVENGCQSWTAWKTLLEILPIMDNLPGHGHYSR